MTASQLPKPELKTQYKYINFAKAEDNPKTWICRNNKSGTELGHVDWYFAWRQWCYFPTCPAIYSDGCLNDIINFIKQLKAEEKE